MQTYFISYSLLPFLQNLLTQTVSEANTGNSDGDVSSCVVPRAPDVSGVMTRIVRLTVERIDRTRRVAGVALAALIHRQVLYGTAWVVADATPF